MAEPVSTSGSGSSFDIQDVINNIYQNGSTVTPEGTAPGNDLGQSKYTFDYTIFPNDIGMEYQGHYCIININVPTKGIKGNGLTVNPVAGAFGSYFEELNQVSKLDTLRYGTYQVPGAPGAAQRTTFSIPRNTRRIAESVALFMPTPLTFNSHNVYEEISLSALAGKGIGIAAQIGSGLLGTLTSIPFVGPLVFRPGEAALGGVGAVASAGYDVLNTAMKIAQSPINPAIEVIFANTLQRQFIMEWLMAPRNEEESFAIQKIVQKLRFHAAPEINSDYGGFMWIPPADFDITFFNKGVENTNILRINTCVLERCEVQYDPTGVYSTFRNGHPVAVRLSLAFRELEPVHKLRILQGF